MTRETFDVAQVPVCLEAEQQLLGALLRNNEILAAVSPYVGLEDFGEPVHARIFDVALRLIGDGQPATPATIGPHLGDYPVSSGVTTSMYMAHLCASVMAPSLAPGQARFIRSVAARRALVMAGRGLVERAAAMIAGEDPASIAADAIGELQQVAASSGADTAQHAGDLADGLLKVVEGIRSGEVVHRTISTGYPDLDRAMNGYDPGTLVVAAGRPGMGKTAFMNSSAVRCARAAGVGVLEFPLEVGAQQLTSRHLADLAFFGDGRSAEFRNIGTRAGELTEDQVDHVRSARDRLRALPIVIDGRARVTVAQIGAKVVQSKRAMAAQGVPLGVVFVDHLDFVQASDRYRGNRTQEIGEICLGLKALARAEGVCVVLLCQLNRDVDKRPEHERRPTLADLRNSGDIEQVADVVIFLYRPEYYLARSPDYLAGEPEALARLDAARGKLELVLGKVRAGPTPTVHLYCAPSASSISSAVRGAA